MGFLDWIGAWYLVRGRRRKVDREEVRRIVEDAYRRTATRDELAEEILRRLGYRKRR